MYSNRIANAEGRYDAADLKEIEIKTSNISDDAPVLASSPRPTTSNSTAGNATGGANNGNNVGGNGNTSTTSSAAGGKEDVNVPEKAPKAFPHLYSSKSVTSNFDFDLRFSV